MKNRYNIAIYKHKIPNSLKFLKQAKVQILDLRIKGLELEFLNPFSNYHV